MTGIRRRPRGKEVDLGTRDRGVSRPRRKGGGTEGVVRPGDQAGRRRTARVAHVIDGRGWISPPFVFRSGTENAPKEKRSMFWTVCWGDKIGWEIHVRFWA